MCTRWENFLRIGITVRYLKSWRCELWIWRSHFGTSSGYGILNSTHAILGSINRTRQLFIRKLSRYKTLCITVIDNSFNYHYFHITGFRNVWLCYPSRARGFTPGIFVASVFLVFLVFCVVLFLVFISGLECPMLTVFLECLFLTVPSVFSNIYDIFKASIG